VLVINVSAPRSSRLPFNMSLQPVVFFTTTIVGGFRRKIQTDASSNAAIKNGKICKTSWVRLAFFLPEATYAYDTPTRQNNCVCTFLKINLLFGGGGGALYIVVVYL
jgi:hypothetical protein